MKNSVSKTVRLGLLTALASASLPAAAAPSAYSTDYGALDIKQVSSATLLRDTESEKTVWVLPPTAGTSALTGFAPSANIRFCDGLKSLTTTSNNIVKKFDLIQKRYEEELKSLTKAEKALVKAREAKAAIEGSTVGASQLILLDEAIEAAESTRDSVLTDLDVCTDEALCSDLIEEYRSLKDRLKDLREERDTIASENIDLDRKLKAADRKINVALEVFNDIGTATDTMAERISTLDSTIQDLYANRGKLEGGFATVAYDTGWDQAIEKLSEANEGYSFNKIRTEETRLHANIIGASDSTSYYESLPAILDYNIEGHKYLPAGEKTVGDGQTSLPSVINGTMRFSLIGGCPVVDSTFFDGLDFKMRTDLNSDPVFAISATYKYPAAYKYKVTASYNLYKFYETIKKNGKKGGFFSSKAYSKVIETKSDSDSFSIDWDVQDSQFSATEKAKITTDLKTDLVNRVLVSMATPVSANAPTLALDPPGAAPEPGSIVLADGLSKTCGWHLYCRAGSWILRGADAIWGRRESEQSFKSTWNRTATETWSSQDVRLTPGATSFRQK